MKTIFATFLILVLCSTSGCIGDSGSGSSASPAIVAAPSDGSGGTSDPTDPSGGGSGQSGNGSDPEQNQTSVSLTYYSLSVTEAPVSGWSLKTVTMTGSCATYQTKTYCWDDGMKTLASWTFGGQTMGPFNYTYWGLMTNASASDGYSLCFGGCSADYLTTGRDVSQNAVGTNIQSESNDTGNTVNEVFSQGVQSTATCTEANGVLNCGSFSINL